MNPSFPSVTFPNHWTLATGLYPESHGIVGNEFYDPELHESFFYKDPKLSWDSKWWHGEPIWITTVLQNVSSAVLMWPGCSTTIHNTTPTYHVDYSDDLSLDDKVDVALNWLDIENVDERPQLIALYFPDVDQMGHRNGPDSKEVNQVISQADTMIGRLVAEIDDRGLSDWVNIVVTSDHGMSNSSLDRLIFYDEILSPDLMQYVGETEAWPLLGIRPNTSDLGIQQRMYDELALWAELHHHPHYQVYQRPDIPEKWHFSHSQRITPILAVPDLGWAFVTHSTFDIKTRKVYRPIGIHGYDNFEEEMRAIFVAKGPAFEAMVGGRGKVVQGFQNIELYEVLAGILRVHPAPNNATLHGRLLPL
ncbi:hypothetical protein BZG36_04293 [Bifiguratus adelaidae]|uniref:Uncharacterized protein n=1 Tax=Bifiguratus adelaidae TaxID=1938954 RepID=A0A261XVD2_9FUNG|nr:hypothetical protein BZG36_04293 [Bifiguratus adelaidae]